MEDPARTPSAPGDGGGDQALSNRPLAQTLNGAQRIVFRRVPAHVVYPLRHAVLRTGRQWRDTIYGADTDPLSAHFAAILDNGEQGAENSFSADAVVLAVGSVLPETPEWPGAPVPDDPVGPGEVDHRAWRVRGMAVRADSRGSGLGTHILGSLLTHVATQGGGLVWCTARIPAMSLYERAGFIARGNPIKVPGIGIHQVMSTG